MNGGLTLKQLEILKQKAKNLDVAIAWIRGRIDSEKLIQVSQILRKDLDISA